MLTYVRCLYYLSGSLPIKAVLPSLHSSGCSNVILQQTEFLIRRLKWGFGNQLAGPIAEDRKKVHLLCTLLLQQLVLFFPILLLKNHLTNCRQTLYCYHCYDLLSSLSGSGLQEGSRGDMHYKTGYGTDQTVTTA